MFSLWIAAALVSLANAAHQLVSNFILADQKDLAITGPFAGQLPNYSAYGAIDIHEQSVGFGRHQPNQNAALWSKRPNQHEGWQITAKLRIRGDELGGNGMAFWYTKEGHAGGPVMGAPDKWTGVAVLLDTYDDDNRGNNPAIMGIINDGGMTYRANQDGEGQYFAGCLRNIRNLPNQPLYVRITYMQGLFKVELDDNSNGKNYVGCFEKTGISLPSGYFFGVSASTNDYPDSMELLEMTVNGAMVSDPIKMEELKKTMQGINPGQVQSTMQFEPEAIVKMVDATVANRIGSMVTETNARIKGLANMLETIEKRVGHLSESMAELSKALQSLSENVHHLDNGHLGEALHQQADEIKRRIDGIQMEAARVKAPEQKEAVPHGWWMYFLVAQVIIALAFFLVKSRMDSRDKKFM